MTDQEIISKATVALKKLELYNEDQYESVEVLKMMDDILLEIDPEIAHKYCVMFSYKLLDGRRAHTSVHVDRKTHKLLTILTRHNMYEVPEDLR